MPLNLLRSIWYKKTQWFWTLIVMYIEDLKDWTKVSWVGKQCTPLPGMKVRKIYVSAMREIFVDQCPNILDLTMDFCSDFLHQFPHGYWKRSTIVQTFQALSEFWFSTSENMEALESKIPVKSCILFIITAADWETRQRDISKVNELIAFLI